MEDHLDSCLHSWHSASRAERKNDPLAPLFIAFPSYLKLPFCYWEQQQQPTRSVTGNMGEAPEDGNFRGALIFSPLSPWNGIWLKLLANCWLLSCQFQIQPSASARQSQEKPWSVLMRQCFSSVLPSSSVTGEGMSKQQRNRRWKLKSRQDLSVLVLSKIVKVLTADMTLTQSCDTS